MSQIRYFFNMPIALNKKRIDEAMGYVGEKSSTFERVRALSMPSGAMLFLDAEVSESRIALAGGKVIESRDAAKALAGCAKAVLIAATAGAGIDGEIALLARTGKTGEALYYAKIAAESVNAALRALMRMAGAEAAREGGRALRKRISPGFGDFDIKYQKLLYDCLGLEKLGVSILESYLFCPERTAAAIMGVRYDD